MLIVVSDLYYFLRYPLQYGDTSTSPTYSATPLFYQAGKYGLFALMLAALFVLCCLHAPRLRLRTQDALPFVVLGSVLSYACLMTLIAIFTQGAAAAGHMLKALFVIPAAFFIPAFYQENTLGHFERVFKALFKLHLLYSAVQVILFLSTGRLPALAYIGGVPRFGGGYDDPNAFGIFLIIPLLYAIGSRGLRRRRLLLLAITALLLATQSLTAIGAALLAVTTFCLIRGMWKTLMAAVAMAAAIAIAILATPGIIDLIILFVTMKQGSIEAHARSMDLGSLMAGHTIAEYVLGSLRGAIASESFYVISLVNYGAVATLILVTLLSATALLGFMKARSVRRSDPHRELLLAACTAFVLAVTVGALNLPLLGIFPVNLYFWIAAALIWTVPTRNVTCEAPHLSPHEELMAR